MDKKIIILARISTAQQDIESQTNDLIREAERLGYSKENQIIIETVESAIKLSEEERLGLNKMKHYIENDSAVDCVICWEPSRLARQQKILFSIRDYLVSKKIQLIILNPYVRLLNDDRSQIDTTANIVFSLFATLSENEMSIKKERFQRAKKEMKQRGQKFGGATIYGYVRNEEKKCVPHPYYSQIVVDVFNHYISTDDSLHETYLYLSSKYPQDFPITTYKKGQRRVSHFFEIEVYAFGNWCYPPIITEDMWNKVKEKKSKSVCRARYNTKRQLLCRGKIFCAHCGRMMTGCGGNINAYCCDKDKVKTNNSINENHHSIQINADIADWVMWEETKSVIIINSAFDYHNKVQEINTNISQKENLKNQYNEAKKQVQQKKDKLVGLYIENKIDESVFNKRNNELISEENIYVKNLNKLETEIRSLRSILEDTQKDLLQPSPINVNDVEDFATRQEFVRKYISKMNVENVDGSFRVKKITFEYAFPVITAKSSYIYEYKNQGRSLIYRINEDGTKDLIHETSVKFKRNSKGRFVKIE